MANKSAGSNEMTESVARLVQKASQQLGDSVGEFTFVIHTNDDGSTIVQTIPNEDLKSESKLNAELIGSNKAAAFESENIALQKKYLEVNSKLALKEAEIQELKNSIVPVLLSASNLNLNREKLTLGNVTTTDGLLGAMQRCVEHLDRAKEKVTDLLLEASAQNKLMLTDQLRKLNRCLKLNEILDRLKYILISQGISLGPFFENDYIQVPKQFEMPQTRNNEVYKKTDINPMQTKVIHIIKNPQIVPCTLPSTSRPSNPTVKTVQRTENSASLSLTTIHSYAIPSQYTPPLEDTDEDMDNVEEADDPGDLDDSNEQEKTPPVVPVQKMKVIKSPPVKTAPASVSQNTRTAPKINSVKSKPSTNTPNAKTSPNLFATKIIKFPSPQKFQETKSTKPVKTFQLMDNQQSAVINKDKPSAKILSKVADETAKAAKMLEEKMQADENVATGSEIEDAGFEDLMTGVDNTADIEMVNDDSSNHSAHTPEATDKLSHIADRTADQSLIETPDKEASTNAIGPNDSYLDFAIDGTQTTVAKASHPSSVAEVSLPSSVAEVSRPSSVGDVSLQSSVGDMSLQSSVADADSDADMEGVDDLEDTFKMRATQTFESDSEGENVKGSVKKKKKNKEPRWRRHVSPNRDKVCGECGKEFRCHYLLRDHMRLHTGERPFKCETCGKGFRLPSYLKDHIHVHSGERPFKCAMCPMTFKRASDASNHRRVHNVSQLIKCKSCSREFMKKSEFTKHMKRHAEGRQYPCSVCKFCFYDRQHLKKHLMDQHNIDIETGQLATGVKKRNTNPVWNKRKICPICGKSLAHESFQAHLDLHTNTKRYKCDICGAAFTQRGGLFEHKKRQHTLVKDFPCELCNRQFIRYSALKNHMISHEKHNKNVGFFCKICGKRLLRKWSYAEHMILHTGKKEFTCPHCGKGFYTSRVLKAHINKNHSNDPMEFKCQKCNKSFDKQTKLARHMHVHLKSVKAFPCEICNEVIGTRAGKTMHMHHRHPEYRAMQLQKAAAEADTTFQCQICHKNMKNQNGLSLHINKVHGKVEGGVQNLVEEVSLDNIEDLDLIVQNENVRFKCTSCEGIFTQADWQMHTCPALQNEQYIAIRDDGVVALDQTNLLPS